MYSFTLMWKNCIHSKFFRDASMKASHILIAAFATMAYLYSVIVSVFYFAYLLPPRLVDSCPDALVPYNIHRAATVTVHVLPAWVSDSVLLALFCLPHSLFAHEKTKSTMNLPKVCNLHDGPCAARTLRIETLAPNSPCL